MENTILIGIHRKLGDDGKYWYSLYFRNQHGQPFEVVIFDSYGMADLYNNTTVPHMTPEEFEQLSECQNEPEPFGE